MPFSPDSTIFLLNVPLTADSQNQIDFADAAAQTAYFQSRIVRSFNNYTYQRKEGYIRVGVEADLLWRCNYVMYQNANFTNKWFYAFVTRVEYVNPSCTFLHIKTDVFQTWQFDIKYFDSYVIREHVEDDTPGLHTLPENLETGDPISCGTVSITGSLQSNTPEQFDNNFICVVAMSEPLKIDSPYQFFDGIFGGVPDFCYYYAVPRTSMRTFQRKIDEKGQGAAVISAYTVPKYFVNIIDTGMNVDDKPIYQIDDKSNVEIDDRLVYMGNGFVNFNGFTPQNRKLLTYPYQFLTLRNNNGSTVDLKIENFYNTDDNANYARFATYCTPTINGCLTVAPRNYMQTGAQPDSCSFQFSVEYSAFPQIAYSSDTYSNYVALNSNSLAMQKTEIAVRGAFAVSKMDKQSPLSAVESATDVAFSIGNYVADQADREAQPRAIHGTPSGNVELKSGSAGVFVSSMCIKNEYAQMIDEFFTKFGYQVNKTKIPQFKSRKNHNYIQTRDINLTADAPQDDITEIKSMFNNGVTFWHDPSTFGNYAYDNGVKV